MTLTNNKMLLSDIVSSDFLFITESNKNVLNILNLFEINKNLKQLIKILLFVKQQKNSKVYFLIKNKFVFYFVKKYLKSYFISSQIVVISALPTFKNLDLSVSSSSLILNFENINIDNSLVSKFLENNFFLVYSIGLNINKNSSGIYSMKNNFDDYKKIIFFLIIVTQVLNKK